MKTLKSFAVAAVGLLYGSALLGQIPGSSLAPRRDDEFQKKMVVSRIDLSEKINLPLTEVLTSSLYSESEFTENQGIVHALINGLKAGKYLGYDPDDVSKPLTYEDIVALSERINGNSIQEEWIEEEVSESEAPMYEDEEEISDAENENSDGMSDGLISKVEGEYVQIAPLESVIELIGNRIVDKNKSTEIHDIKYVRLVWVDPGETLPDKNFVCFKYSDLVETLEHTRWANKYNDAEDRNMREIFEQRLFNEFVINVSGRDVRTLAEAQHRANQMMEFEHHLWNY